MSGLYSQLGFSNESTYGTYVAPTDFLKTKNWKITPKYERPQGEGIQKGILGPLDSHHVQTTQAAEASFDIEVVTAKMGKLLQWIMGGTSTSTVNDSSSYTQVHTLAALTKSGTFQGGAPYRNLTNVAQTLKGGMITSAEFSCAVTELLSCSVSVDGQSFVTSESLASASYVADKPFTGAQATVKLGTYESESAVAGVKNCSLSFARALDTEDYTFGSNGLKSQPVDNGDMEITGSIEVEWTAATKAAFQDRFVANTATSFVWEFDTGVAIESGYNQLLRFTVPGIRFDGEAQGVDGKEALMNSWDFQWRYDGTNLPKIEYVTADTAI